MSWVESSMATPCSSAIRAKKRDGFLGALDVEVGEGLVEQQQPRVGVTRAWAMRTLCCSPPDSAPTPGVGEAQVASTASSISSTRLVWLRDRSEEYQDACPSMPSSTRSRARTWQVRVEHDLLGDVTDERRPDRPPAACDHHPTDAAGGRGRPGAAWSCRHRSCR